MQRLEQAAQGGAEPDTMAVVVAPDKTILVGENFIIHPTSIEIVGQIDRVKWVGFMKWVHSLEGTIQWGLGDMVMVADQYRDEWLKEIETEDEPESKYQFLLEESGYSYSSLRKFASFANRFPVFRRRNTISYSHHVEVVDLPAEQGDSFLDRAEANGWSVRELRKQIQAAELPAEVSPADEPPLPGIADSPTPAKEPTVVMLRSPLKAKEHRQRAMGIFKKVESDLPLTDEDLQEAWMSRAWFDEVIKRYQSQK